MTFIQGHLRSKPANCQGEPQDRPDRPRAPAVPTIGASTPGPAGSGPTWLVLLLTGLVLVAL